MVYDQMGKKRLDSDKHYGGKKICSSPRQQGRRSRITSLYIRRRAAAVFLFSSLPISSTFLLFMSSLSLSFHSLTLRNATHWWLGAGPHGDQRGEKEEAGEKHREEPWSGLTVYFLLKPVSAGTSSVSGVTLLPKHILYVEYLQCTGPQ